MTKLSASPPDWANVVWKIKKALSLNLATLPQMLVGSGTSVLASRASGFIKAKFLGFRV